jgi:hypothetical protein
LYTVKNDASMGNPPLYADAQILNAYDAAGIKMVRLSHATKRAVDPEWQHKTLSLEEAARWVARGGDIGLQAGERSGWLCFLDLDDYYLRVLAPRFLPDTLAAGKEGEEYPSHYAYIAEGLNYKQITDCEGDEFLAIKAASKGQGHQCVVEPSVHPTKGPYRWAGGFDPNRITRISAEDLERRTGRLAAAALIAKYLPDGGRHWFALRLFGFLLRNGESAESALELATPAWELETV